MRKSSINVHVMVGIQGSGKSTYAQKNCHDNGVIISSDAIREEFENTLSNKEVFALVHKRLEDAIVNDVCDVYVDATSISIRSRKNILDIVKRHKDDKDITVIADVMTTSLETSIFRNNNRERKVPVEVIKRYSQIFEMPTKEEGFDIINCHGEEEK